MSLAIFGIIGQIVVFALVALAARVVPTKGKAVALGVFVGVVGMFVLGFLFSLLGNVLPMGQMDFWLARQIGRLN